MFKLFRVLCYFGNSFVSCLKVKHTPTVLTQLFLPYVFTQKDESICPYKDSYKNANNSFIYDSKHLKKQPKCPSTVT